MLSGFIFVATADISGSYFVMVLCDEDDHKMRVCD